jgi:predicted RNA-binding Zn-ribbon protein involved in translation (DUF1610 family)
MEKKLDDSAVSIIIHLIRNGNFMSQIKFECSHCKQALEYDEQYSVCEIPCPMCGGFTVVPPVPERTAAAPRRRTGTTFVPESWQKPEKGKTAPAPKKTGMTHRPESWQSPPQAGAE